jgi:hypothetical protein
MDRCPEGDPGLPAQIQNTDADGSILSRNERERIEAECELLSRWFPLMFPVLLLRAIEQGTLHGGLLVDPDRKGCGDPYGHLLNLPEKWQQAAQLARGIIAALKLEGEDMTPLQQWIASVRPGQTHLSSQRLAILYKNILPQYLAATPDLEQMLQEAVNNLSALQLKKTHSDDHRQAHPHIK